MVSNVWANWEQKCGNEYDHESDQNGNENNDANADYEDDDDDDNWLWLMIIIIIMTTMMTMMQNIYVTKIFLYMVTGAMKVN